MGRLDGCVAMITGGCGGLGRGLASGLAREGASLFLTDIDERGVESAVDELRSQGIVAHGTAADLRDSASVSKLVETALSVFPNVNVLVNNAGISETKSFWDLTEADWDRMLSVNVKGTFMLLQALAGHMASNGGGSIINIASVAGRAGRPMLLHYAASKAAVISITRSAALALASYHIRVNAIAPGMIDTEMLHGLQREWKEIAGNQSVPTPSAIPIGRVAQPADLVGAAIFLASQESAYITGQTLNVCGGLVLS
ncbi:MAG: SDR family NAD(P)-dependent oxidoreductase [Bryobacteraceae bacterium]